MLVADAHSQVIVPLYVPSIILIHVVISKPWLCSYENSCERNSMWLVPSCLHSLCELRSSTCAMEFQPLPLKGVSPGRDKPICQWIDMGITRYSNQIILGFYGIARGKQNNLEDSVGCPRQHPWMVHRVLVWFLPLGFQL